MNNGKSHAKDYLLEYKAKKDTPKWIAFLIQKVIDTNAKVSDDEKNAVFQELLRENGVKTEQSPEKIKNESVVDQAEITKDSKKQKLTLQKITHIKGVNALISNQSITFSPACTVIYGLNGTGKSGYFRIIHELAGGIKSKDILGNIHKQGDGLEVDIEFLLDDKAQNPFTWEDKTLRGILPFNQIKVFDSEYLPIFLDERENSVNIEPLGLNYFQEIATIIDEFKEKLNQTKQQKQNQCPDLKILTATIHSADIKGLLGKTSLTKQEEIQIDGYKIFSNEDTIKLDKLKNEKDSLERNSTEDSKKVLNQEKQEIANLKQHLLGLKTGIEELTKNTSSAINDYLEKKNSRDERANEFEVLKNIPAQNTEEWQAFIESAKEYGKAIDNVAMNKDKKCIYCHQPLSEDAIKLVQAYAQYLDDQSQQNFKNTVDKLSGLEEENQNLITDFSFSESLNEVLSKLDNEQKQDYKTLVRQVIEEAKKQKSILGKAIKDETIVSEEFTLDLLKAEEKLEELSKKKQNELNSMQQSDTQKKRKISELIIEINELEDKKYISEWKTNIEDYYIDCQFVQKLSSVNQTISTRAITELGSKAHAELLTDSLRVSFEDELKSLGKDIEVNLKQAGAGKGTVWTRIEILGNDVRNILSDGEQKAVGLALFLAEVKSQNNKCPIVFDDPVTSLDHEIADSLAKKLLCLSSDRQIIIFTHNKLFYDSLVYWGNQLKDERNNKTHHVCKNYTQKGCNGKGCHVYTYRVDKEAKDKTGRVFEAQNESCSYYIEKAESEMKDNPSLSCVAGYLKLAIEYYIDEKVLNNQSLCKDKKFKDHIEWKMLKGLNPSEDVINQLKTYWDDLSSRGTHLSTNSSENPLSIEILRKIINFLKK